MSFAEQDIPGYESDLALGRWVEDIKQRWNSIPKFRVDAQKLKHLAIICDGNRRAAEARGLPSSFGHRAGIEAIKDTARAARKWDIHTITFWVWSTENWQRDREQVEFVMSLAEHFLPQEELLEEFVDNEVRFRHLGRKDRLPATVQSAIANLERQTAGFQKYNLNLALDYGGVDEVARAIVEVIRSDTRSALFSEHPGVIASFLDTRGQPDVDLVVRTGMKKEEVFRTSGFMPLQTAYSGWIPLSVLFPDLTPRKLAQAIKKFQGYKMRRGV